MGKKWSVSSFSGNGLSLEGAVFDKIESVSSATWHLTTCVTVYKITGQVTERYSDMLSYYEVLGSSTSIYQSTGENLTTAVWRTMIGNIANGKTPASPEIEMQFLALLVHQCMILQEKGVSLENSVLYGLLSSSSAGELTSDQDAADFLDAAKTICGSIDTSELEAALGNTAFDRCLYRTSKGVIGLCPPDTNPGDKVWLLQGARVPFVPSSVTGEAYHRLIGDTYVHSFMHGKMLTDELRGRIGKVSIR